MTIENNARNRESLIEMARTFMRGKVLCAAVRLGIPDALADEQMTLPELAAATRSNPESLHRLMRALASLGVVEESEPARFHLTALGEPLRRNAPRSAWASVVFWADLLADFWNYLPQFVRTGKSASAAGAMEELGITPRWSMDPGAQAIFHDVFAEPSADDMALLLAAYDFSGGRVVADLGGAGGGLIAAILTANPQARGILVDRQEAVDRASARLENAGLADRCQLVVGDLLQAVPDEADIYILKNVLHGYDDESAGRLLQLCQAAMQSQSRLLIIETVLPDSIDPSDPRAEEMFMADLNMMAVTGGRERSANEWTELLASARLKPKRTAAVADSNLSVIEAAVSAP